MKNIYLIFFNRILMYKNKKDFDVGQLVHLQSFTLFDAMSAIEIMDPRMDTGMLIEEKPNKFDILKKLTTEETLGIMDRLLTREMAWISGHSLSQTVYTCIYFHHIQVLNQLPMPTLTSDIDNIIYGVLKTYVLATVKCCHYIWTEMTQGNVFEVPLYMIMLYFFSYSHLRTFRRKTLQLIYLDFRLMNKIPM
jgi:hypothetical protein